MQTGCQIIFGLRLILKISYITVIHQSASNPPVSYLYIRRHIMSLLCHITGHFLSTIWLVYCAITLHTMVYKSMSPNTNIVELAILRCIQYSKGIFWMKCTYHQSGLFTYYLISLTIQCKIKIISKYSLYIKI